MMTEFVEISDSLRKLVKSNGEIEYVIETSIPTRVLIGDVLLTFILFPVTIVMTIIYMNDDQSTLFVKAIFISIFLSTALNVLATVYRNHSSKQIRVTVDKLSRQTDFFPILFRGKLLFSKIWWYEDLASVEVWRSSDETTKRKYNIKLQRQNGDVIDLATRLTENEANEIAHRVREGLKAGHSYED